jgi:hypothetical protein
VPRGITSAEFSIFDVTNSAVAVSTPLFFRVIDRQFARTLRLSGAPMLAALHFATRTLVADTAGARRRDALAEWMSGLRLELLGDILLGAPAVAAMGIAALSQWFAELLALLLPKVRHVILLVDARAIGRERAPRMTAARRDQ